MTTPTDLRFQHRQRRVLSQFNDMPQMRCAAIPFGRVVDQLKWFLKLDARLHTDDCPIAGAGRIQIRKGADGFRPSCIENTFKLGASGQRLPQ